MTTPSVNPVLTVHKIFQSDTSGSLLTPVYAFFERLTESFTQPAVGNSVTVLVADSTKYAVGQSLWINGIGFLEITGTPDATHLYVENNDAEGNEDPGTTVPVGTIMSVSIPVSPAAAVAFEITDELAQAFTVPSGTNDAILYVSNGGWYKVGMQVYVQGAGWFRITSYDSTTDALTVKNAGSFNVASGTIIASGTVVFPSQAPTMAPDNAPAIQRGVELAVATTNANDTVGAAVVFPFAFTTAPTVVMLTVKSTAALGAIFGAVYFVRNITTTGFNLCYSANAVFTADIEWVAIM